MPVHALARSLANLEAVFGQLFPGTLLARLVSLHLVHDHDAQGRRDRAVAGVDDLGERNAVPVLPDAPRASPPA